MQNKKSRKLIVLSLKWYDIRIHQGVLDYAKDHDWDVLANPHSPQALDIPEVDGQIVMLGDNDRRRTKIALEAFGPVVDLGCYRPDIEFPRVLPDNYRGGQLAAEFFLERGYTNLAVFSTQTHWYVNDRLNGFRDTVVDEGASCDHWHVPQTDLHKGSFDPSSTLKNRLEEWLTQAPKPLAVYAIEDEGAAILLRACLQLGIAVPEQVSLIGTNNDPVVCPYTAVPLSSVDLNWEGVGFEAAAMLDKLMQGQTLPETLHKVLPEKMVSRKSSDAIAVKDLRVAKTLSYIWENSRGPITVPEIAKYVGVPLRTLQWAFQRSMDCSLLDEINRQRLKHVKALLCDTDRSIEKIAVELRFSSAQYLNHFFSKATGITPSEYRQQKQRDCTVQQAPKPEILALAPLFEGEPKQADVV